MNPVLEQYDNIVVVRDDLLKGGSKSRFLPFLIQPDAKEVVYGSPFCGAAAVSLSVIAQEKGFKASIFYAARKNLHRRQLQAQGFGASLHFVPFGYMTNVQKKARDYARSVGAQFLPLGFDLPEAGAAFSMSIDCVRESLNAVPDQVWCATGSGMLARCLAKSFPDSEICAVAVGLASRHSKQPFPANVRLLIPRYKFEQRCNIAVPFPACPHYERKAWDMMKAQGKGIILFWNVMGD